MLDYNQHMQTQGMHFREVILYENVHCRLRSKLGLAVSWSVFDGERGNWEGMLKNLARMDNVKTAFKILFLMQWMQNFFFKSSVFSVPPTCFLKDSSFWSYKLYL